MPEFDNIHMKKNITSIKSPTPATKPAAAKRAASAPTTSIPAPAVTKRGRLKTLVSTALRFETPAAPPAATTTILARIDVGFGNGLYLRGDGPGLNWGAGTKMDNVASDLWALSLEGACAPVRFKFLINDESWCTGDDYIADPGSKTTHDPQF
jgi:hypothetical protein